jgi:hypothetical protein
VVERPLLFDNWRLAMTHSVKPCERGRDISYADWIATVKAYAAEEGVYTYEELAEQYSFESAYNDEMGMLEAYTDCCNWLEG